MIYNFSPGPSILPPEVREELAKTLLNSRGDSIVEISDHASSVVKMMDETTQLVRELGDIPDTHSIFWSYGGARIHFSSVPGNLMKRDPSHLMLFADTGIWSTLAEQEAKRYGPTQIITSSADKKHTYIPDIPDHIRGSYLHIVPNNTTEGTAYQQIPDVNIPLVGDFTSDIFTRVVDFSKFGVAFAGVQKNLGFSGLTLLIIRNDLIDIENVSNLPTLLSFKSLAEHNSRLATPNTLSMYTCNLMLKWIKANGGLRGMEIRNRAKAAAIYDVLDSSKLYIPKVKKEFRSIINITFDLPSEELRQKFIKESESEGLLFLAGYSQVGGIRASMYNAMPLEGALALAAFMKRFESRYL